MNEFLCNKTMAKSYNWIFDVFYIFNFKYFADYVLQCSKKVNFALSLIL